MKFDKELKLIECTQKEKEVISMVSKEYCILEAIDVIFEMFIKKKLTYTIGYRKWFNTNELKDMAYNAIQAVKNNYKYLKITKE